VVRDGDGQSAAVLTVLCGTRNGETVTSTGEALSVQLVTDSSRQRQGFAATFSFVDADSVTVPRGLDRRPMSTTTAAVSNGSASGRSPLTGNGDQINVPGRLAQYNNNVINSFVSTRTFQIEIEIPTEIMNRIIKKYIPV